MSFKSLSKLETMHLCTEKKHRQKYQTIFGGSIKQKAIICIPFSI